MTTLAIIILILLGIACIAGLAAVCDSPGEFFAILGLIIIAGLVIGVAQWAGDVIISERHR